MQRNLQIFLQWWLLICIVIALCFFYYFRLYNYLNFSTLKQYNLFLHSWTAKYYLSSVLIYMLVYILATAIAIPGAVFLTLVGGFLYGPIATVYVVLSATTGATILFLAVRGAFGEWLSQRVSGSWISKMQKGFQQNAFTYLLFLRLMPIFPFWAVNIVAGLLSVRWKTFIIATLIGIIPGAYIYVLLGNSFRVVFDSKQTPDLNIIFSPPILLPLIVLAVLALLPVIYKRIKKK